VNNAAVEMFLWRGSPNPRMAQRFGAWLLGLLFLTGGIAIIGDAQQQQSILLGIFGAGWIFLGVRVFRNGFRVRLKDGRA
jgi:hypothetical protein